jgi:uncharacterized RDD family membrane protein YckC
MPSIDIQTTQNVTIDYELASLRERFFAFFIDLIIFYSAYVFIWLFILFTFGNAITGWGMHFIQLMLIAGFMAYHLLAEIFAGGQSIGKKVLRLKVVRLDGREPGLSDYLYRSIFLLIDFFLSFGVLAALLIGSTFNSQRLGDLAAGTAVIRIKNRVQFSLDDILTINTLQNYEPKYLGVRMLGEADVLLIKNLLARYQAYGNVSHAEAISEAVKRICEKLQIKYPPGNSIEFLKTLIRDYIVLTR